MPGAGAHRSRCDVWGAIELLKLCTKAGIKPDHRPNEMYCDQTIDR